MPGVDSIPLLAVLAAVAAFWGHLQGLLGWLRSLVIQRATLNGQVSQSVSDYLYAQARVIRWGDILIGSSSAWVRPLDRVAEVAFEKSPSRPLLAVWRRTPLLFYSPSSANQHGGMPELPCTDLILNITYLRGTVDIARLTQRALEFSMQRQTTGHRYRVQVISGKSRAARDSLAVPQAVGRAPKASDDIRPGMRFLHWQAEEIGAPTTARPFDTYALSPEAAAAREDFQRWVSLRAWYQQRGIPWRRGHLLHGPPGTGKTALVRALAQEADMPVFAYDLSTLDNAEFREQWQEMQESTPCIALLEDIDGVFHGRENVVRGGEMQGGLSFDCLLNALGGIQTADGVFVVITTNARDTLDPALTRPGRLDREFCLPAPLDDQRAHILRRICGAATPNDLDATVGMTAAQVTEWAISTALQRQWQAAA